MEPQSTQGGDFQSIALDIQRIVASDGTGVLALVIRSIGSAPGRVGAKMLVFPDGNIKGTVGGGVIEARVIADSLRAMEDQQGPRTLQYNLGELGMSCGGEMSVYLEPIEAPRKVIIYGGGHVGAAVAKVLGFLGCRLVIVDERDEWANRDRFPDVLEIVNLPFSTQIEKNPPGPKDHVIIVTRGHEQDQLVLEKILPFRPAYLGMIGSRKKAAQALEALKAKNVPLELLQQVRSPIGLSIGAQTPEEIAIAIAGELIMKWRKGNIPVTRPPKSGLRPLGKTLVGQKMIDKEDVS